MKTNQELTKVLSENKEASEAIKKGMSIMTTNKQQREQLLQSTNYVHLIIGDKKYVYYKTPSYTWKISLNNKYTKLSPEGIKQITDYITMSSAKLAKLGFVRSVSKKTRIITITKKNNRHN